MEFTSELKSTIVDTHTLKAHLKRCVLRRGFQAVRCVSSLLDVGSELQREGAAMEKTLYTYDFTHWFVKVCFEARSLAYSTGCEFLICQCDHSKFCLLDYFFNANNHVLNRSYQLEYEISCFQTFMQFFVCP